MDELGLEPALAAARAVVLGAAQVELAAWTRSPRISATTAR
jgi:hypothetical protein